MLINVKEILKIVKINNVKDVTNVLKQWFECFKMYRNHLK